MRLIAFSTNGVFAESYAYDALGRRVSKNDERYGYNVRGELVLATNVVDGTVFAYAYDDIGNRLWSREFGTNATYAANCLNQYTNIVRGGVGGTSRVRRGWKPDGHRDGDGPVARRVQRRESVRPVDTTCGRDDS